MFDVTIEAERHRLGARIHIAPLKGTMGYSELTTREIWIADDLTWVEMRSTVMHCLGHLALGLQRTGQREVDEATDMQADMWAARRLIPDVVWEYVQDKGRDDREIAELCQVDPAILEARRRLDAMPPRQRLQSVTEG